MKRTKCHQKKVSCLYGSAAGSTLISGSSDGCVITWIVEGTSLTKRKTFDLKNPSLLSMKPLATSVCDSKSGDSILVSTRGGEIFEFNTSTGNAAVFLRGHFDQELWGLATHPTQP
jgi:WD40 repeat protein